jgi:hypothetical protein
MVIRIKETFLGIPIPFRKGERVDPGSFFGQDYYSKDLTPGHISAILGGFNGISFMDNRAIAESVLTDDSIRAHRGIEYDGVDFKGWLELQKLTVVRGEINRMRFEKRTGKYTGEVIRWTRS